MKKYLSTIICFFLHFLLMAQHNFSFQQLDSRNGLSNSCILDIYQDSDKLLWVGTYDGLNLFDGRNFYVFNYDKSVVGNSINNNIISRIKEDRFKNIWLSTGQGVCRFQKQTGTFTNYSDTISHIFQSITPLLISNKQKDIYIVGRAKSGENIVALYDYGTASFKTVLTQTGPGTIKKAMFDKKNNLLLLSGTGNLTVYQQQISKKKIRFVTVDTFKVIDIFSARDDIYFLNSNNELSIGGAPYREKQFLIKFTETIKAINYYQGHYFVAWENKGCSVYDSAFRSSKISGANAQLINEKLITCMINAGENTLWFGTDGGGIIKAGENKTLFEVISPSSQTFTQAIRSFCVVDNALWVGTKGDGIIALPYTAERINELPAAARKYTYPSNIDNNSIFVMKKSKDGSSVFIGSDGKGIMVYDIAAKKFTKWNEITGHEKYIKFTSVYAITEDEDGSLWLGTSAFGLLHTRIEKKNGKYTIKYLDQYLSGDPVRGPGSNIIFSILACDSDHLLLACRNGGGLSLFNKRKNTFRIIRAFSYADALSHNDVLCLFEDKENRIWIGTSYGLNRINAAALKDRQPAFMKLKTAQGLPSNTVHAITQDNSGQIWVSTNNGLAKINPYTQQIVRFKQEDGLQSNEFSDGAVCKDDAGKIYFGGINGFNYFNPDKVEPDTWRPNLLLTDLKIGGKEVNPAAKIVFNPTEKKFPRQDYSISRNDNFFELRLRPVTFMNANKNQLAYLLKGHDKGWSYAYPGEKIEYSNISPGNYTLIIKWADGAGIWSKEMDAFRINVQQHPWLTTPAIAGYFMLLAIMGYLFYRYRKNKIKLRHELEIETLLRKKDEELHQEKLDFFTNIAHELQTPLTLIVGAAERYNYKSNITERRKEKNIFLSLIHQQSSRLTYLVRQLMDFRKAESGHLKNHYSHLSVSELLLNIAELFIPLQYQKRLDFKWDIEPGILVWIDRDKLEKIIFNLLSNAFKHSSEMSRVLFSVKIDTDRNAIEINVFNSGSYLSHKQIDKIFDRFFVTDDSQEKEFSTGIGLAFTSKLVKIMNGSIETISEENGISFRVSFPLNMIPEDAEIIVKNSGNPEIPSSLIRSVLAVNGSAETASSVGGQNKNALIAGLEKGRKSILIVEDDVSIRYLLKDVFKELYIIYEVENGAEAIEFLLRIQPSLIISDIMMPAMNGLELCSRIKTTPNTCHIPFVLLSARDMMEHQTEGYEVGADAYITKPFHTSHLLTRVKKLLEYRDHVTELFKKETIPSIIGEDKLESSDKNFLESVAAMIEEKMDDTGLNAAFLETALNLSKMQLYRKLKSITNMTPAEFIKLVRLQKAAWFLRHTGLSVSDIFYKTGFNSQSYFYREFKKIYEYSPNEYRAQQNLSAGTT